MRLHTVAFTTAVLAASASALAAGPSPSITGGVIGTGALTGRSSAIVRLSPSSGFVMENASVPALATFGWHYHRTPVVVAITAGTLTLYDSSGPACTPHRYHAGQGFIEPASHLHLARNDGKTAVTLYATYIGVAPSSRANPNNLDANNQPRPHKCPASIQ